MHRPKLLIADDPTAGLVVTIQGRVLNLMQSLARECGTAQLIVTADLGMAARYLRQDHALGTHPARFLRVPDPSLFTSVARRRSGGGGAAGSDSWRRPPNLRGPCAASMRDQRLRLLGDIDRGRQAAGGAGHLEGSSLIPIRHHDAGAPRREKVHATCADAARASGDHDQTARKVQIHVVLPSNLSSANPSSARRHGNRRRHQRSPRSGVNGVRIMIDDS